MQIDADPEALGRTADRLTALAEELLAAAARLGGLTAERARPGRLEHRCAGLRDDLRTDAARLFECARLLREERAALLAGEACALAVLRAVDTRRPGWSGLDPHWSSTPAAP